MFAPNVVDELPQPSNKPAECLITPSRMSETKRRVMSDVSPDDGTEGHTDVDQHGQIPEFRTITHHKTISAVQCSIVPCGST